MNYSVFLTKFVHLEKLTFSPNVTSFHTISCFVFLGSQDDQDELVVVGT